MTLFFAKPLYTTLRSSKEFPVFIWSTWQLWNIVRILRFLRFLTCLSWDISPAEILLTVQTTAIPHSIFYFSSFSLFIQSRISKSVVICSFCSFLFFSPLYLFHPTLFYSSFYFLFCFLPVYSVYFLISLMVFFSNLLSFLFSFPITLFCLLLPYALLLFSLFSFY